MFATRAKRPSCRSDPTRLDVVGDGSALFVTGYVPVALSKSEGAGSVLALVRLSGAHLLIQVLGNTELKRLLRFRHTQPNQRKISAAPENRALVVRANGDRLAPRALAEQGGANKADNRIKHDCSPLETKMGTNSLVSSGAADIFNDNRQICEKSPISAPCGGRLPVPVSICATGHRLQGAPRAPAA